MIPNFRNQVNILKNLFFCFNLNFCILNFIFYLKLIILERQIRDYKEEASKMMDEMPHDYLIRDDFKRYDNIKTTIFER